MSIRKILVILAYEINHLACDSSDTSWYFEKKYLDQIPLLLTTYIYRYINLLRYNFKKEEDITIKINKEKKLH